MAKSAKIKGKEIKLPQLNKRRYVLSIGDEGAILIYMDGARILRRLFAFAPNPQELLPFRELLSADVKAPVHLLLDVMDQSYVPQSLPPVSSFGLNKLIEKRLARDFAPEDIKGALSLGRSEDGRKDWHFLFISVPNAQPTSGWIEFLSHLENRVEGIYLLPVEARTFLSELHDAVHVKKGEDHTPAEWQILVSHNKVGGFRQVVLRHGKLVFTRLTQPIGEAVPGVIAGNIEQEIANTLEYLKRLSFSDASTLEIYVVVAEPIKEALGGGALQRYHTFVFTPFEIANMLALPGAAETGDSFGDVVLGAVFGRSSRKHLRLHTPHTKKLSQLHAVDSWSRIALIGLIPLMILSYIMMLVGMYQASEETDNYTAQKKRAEVTLAEVKKKAASLPENIDRVTDSVDLYEMLSKDVMTPLDTVAAFRGVMDEFIRVKSFSWDVGDFTRARDDAMPQITAVFQVEYTKKQSLEEFHHNMGAFFDRLEKVFPNYEITHSKLPGTIGVDENLEVNFDEAQARPEKVDTSAVVVDVTIVGPKEVETPDDGKGKKNKKKKAKGAKS